MPLTSTASANLQTAARTAIPLMLSLYNRPDPSDILPDIALNIPTAQVAADYTVEWMGAFPQLFEWTGERETSKTWADKLQLVNKLYQATYPIDRLDLMLNEARQFVKSPGDLAQFIATAFRVGRVKNAYDLIAMNEPAPDNQNLFDAGHTHPGDGGLYSNIATVTRASAGNPTVQEARDELVMAAEKLVENRLVRHTVVRADDYMQNILVICRSAGTYKANSDLRNEERIGGNPNRFRHTFGILRDFSPAASVDVKDVDYINVEPGGPRPVAHADISAPTEVIFDDNFKDRMLYIGSNGAYADGIAFPQSCFRVEE